MSKKPFIAKEVRPKECLELVHTNVFMFFNVHGCREYEYFITFIDDYSRYGYASLMHRKFESLNTFKEFKMNTKKELDKHLKTL